MSVCSILYIIFLLLLFSAKSCPAFSNPMDCSTPGFLSFTISQICSNSCPLSQWCHPTTSSSVVPFSSCPQSFPASGSFPVSQLFALGGQSIGASVSVLPMNIQGWFPLGLTGLITPCCSRDSQESSQHHSSKALILWLSAFFMVQLSYPYMTTGKTITLTMWTFVSKVMSLLFNMLSRFVIAFRPRSKHLNFMAAVSLWLMVSNFFPIYLPWSDGTGCHDLSLLKLSFKPAFLLSSYTFIKSLFGSSLLCHKGAVIGQDLWNLSIE